ncbi:3'-5' exonuclease [Duganella sp. CT11-25]|uniref:3'-5' exonuclease n=1 Tax=unclassified Duganella TaxID=2636909 RepID=UPI0039AEDF57
MHQTVISAVGVDRNFPSIITYDSQTTKADLLEEVTRLVTHSVEVAGIATREICILAPQWMPLASLTRRLIAAMPQYEFDGPGMVPFAWDMENFWYKLSRIGLTQASPRMYIKRVRWANEVIRDLEIAGAPVSGITGKALLRASNAFRSAENDGLTYLSDYFDTMFAWLDIDYRQFQTLSEHHLAFFESSSARIEKIAQQGAESIRDIGTFRKVFAERSGITISTIHGVKGGEFDVVIAYGLLQGMVPHFSDPQPHESAAKLLYVTCSRARKHLHLISESERPRGRYNSYSPTELLAATQFNYDHI